MGVIKLEPSDKAGASQPRLDFLIAGVQKAGTTALFHYLRQHPDVFMPEQKELHFFKREPGYTKALDYQRYHRHFDGHLGVRMCGEASPVYLYWPGAMERIHAYNPHIRLVACLRHPVWRAYSAWCMEVRRGRETLPFSLAIRQGRDRVRATPGGVHAIFSYVERGFYSGQLEHALSLFSQRNLFTLRHDAIRPGPELDALQLFLGLESRPLTLLRDVFQPGMHPDCPPLSEEDALYLLSLYEADLRALPELTGLDTSEWLDPDRLVEQVRRSAA